MKSKEVLKLLKITRPTLTKYVKNGIISVVEKPNGQYDYIDNSVYSLLTKNNKRSTAIYCRVSTNKQKNDLTNQVNFVEKYLENNGIRFNLKYVEVGSGVTFNRKEFIKLLFDILDYKIEKLYISNKDRLCRLSFDLIKDLFLRFGCEIIVINDIENEQSKEKEIFEDIISVLHCFAMKMYSGRRKKKLEIVSEDLKNELCN
jgi:predicted site-specific integrase-resolvase